MHTYICLSPVTQAKHFDTCGLILVFASIHVISKLINTRGLGEFEKVMETLGAIESFIGFVKEPQETVKA